MFFLFLSLFLPFLPFRYFLFWKSFRLFSSIISFEFHSYSPPLISTTAHINTIYIYRNNQLTMKENSLSYHLRLSPSKNRAYLPQPVTVECFLNYSNLANSKVLDLCFPSFPVLQSRILWAAVTPLISDVGHFSQVIDCCLVIN